MKDSKISFLNQDAGDSRNFIYGQPRAVSCQDSCWQGKMDKAGFFFPSKNSGINTEESP